MGAEERGEDAFDESSSMTIRGEEVFMGRSGTVSSSMFGAVVRGMLAGLKALSIEREARSFKMFALVLRPLMKRRRPRLPLDAAAELSGYCLAHATWSDCNTLYQTIRESYGLAAA